MMTVKQFIKPQAGNIWSINPDATAFSALELMAEKDIGALPVIENGRLVGIFSERDYARKVILKGKSSKKTTVKELMTEHVHHVRPERTMEECMLLMSTKEIRHLPVVDQHELVGMVTIKDAVKAIIAHRENTIHGLENYISGGYGH